MTRRFPGRVSSLLMIFVFLSFTVNVLPAAEPENKVAGKIYKADHDTGLPDAKVRIVEMNSGASFEDTTDKNGCYEFDDVALGNYSVTVTHEEKEYMYPDKLQIIQTKSQKNLFKRCYGINEPTTDPAQSGSKAGSLTLMPDDECDLCKKFPVIWFVVGAGAAIITAIAVGGDEEASPSTP